VVSGGVKVDLSDEQKKYLKLVIELLEREWKPEDLHQVLYDTARGNGIDTREAFQAIYLPLTGKKYGPKAAWFLLGLDKKVMLERYNKAIKK